MKITEVSEEIIAEALESKTLESEASNSEQTEVDILSFELTKKKGIATFRLPNVIDLIAAEKEVGMTDRGTFSPDYYRYLGSRCWKTWGDLKVMPDEEKMRLADDDQLVITFARYFASIAVETADIETYCKTVEEGDFDLYEIQVNLDTKLVCREPNQKDNKARSLAATTIEGNLAMIAKLCQTYNGKAITVGEVRNKLNRMNALEYTKLSKALTYFRS